MNVMVPAALSDIKAQQIIDSRGIPTVSVEVYLSDGSYGQASVPSGASTGAYEAHEKRDNGQAFLGKSVLETVESISSEIRPFLIERSPKSIYEIDTWLCKLDGTNSKSRLGANAILGISLAFAKALASFYRMPLYRFLGGAQANLMPIPLMNIINGGAHANNNLDIQEFMIVPHGASTFSQAIRMGCETYQSLKLLMIERGYPTSVGDEGGFAPNLQSHEEALDLIINAIDKAGYHAGQDISIALDIASSEWYQDGEYRLPKNHLTHNAESLSHYYEDLIRQYPIISLEDPFSEDDFSAFTAFTKRHPDLQIVGDDLFVTNPQRIQTGIDLSAGNAVLINPNQIVTLSETLHAISLTHEGSFNPILSHRSGDTTDTAIADLAVAVNAGQIKTGAPCRGERVAKYNRLIEIEESLGSASYYGSYVIK